MKIYNLLLLVSLCSLLSCNTTKTAGTNIPTEGLYKISIHYPNGDDKTFDMNYYETKHMPMVAGFLGKNLKFYEIDKGISGRAPADKPPFLAIGYFYCYDVAEYSKAIMANREAIVQDFQKYTNVQPIVQISQIQQIKSGAGAEK